MLKITLINFKKYINSNHSKYFSIITEPILDLDLSKKNFKENNCTLVGNLDFIAIVTKTINPTVVVLMTAMFILMYAQMNTTLKNLHQSLIIIE